MKRDLHAMPEDSALVGANKFEKAGSHGFPREIYDEFRTLPFKFFIPYWANG